jgi:hypothetical protein
MSERVQKVYKGELLMEASYKLLIPIESVEGKQITELKFSRPKNKHTKHMTTTPTGEEMQKLISNICGLTPREVGEIDFLDQQEIMGIVGDFLTLGQPTGLNL